MECRSLGVWLREVTERGHTRLRLATGDNGQTIVPTEGELLVEAEAVAESAEGRARAAKAEAVSAKAEIARLRELLAKIEGGR